MRITRWICGLVVAFGFASVHGSVVLDVDGTGQLLGASGIDVGGTLYDVEFVEGTCIALFDGCDELSDLTFTTEAESGLAAQALLDVVFINGPQGMFDNLDYVNAPHPR